MRSLPGSTKPSSTTSALAGIGRAVTGPLIPSTRLAAHAADDLVLAHPEGHLAAGHQERHGIAAAHDRDRHRLAARQVLVSHLAAMLAGRDVEAGRLGNVDHDPVGAAIDPAVVGIAQYVEAAGADIAAAVRLVPLRRRAFSQVDVVALDHVLED